MTAKLTNETSPGQPIADAIKSWVMVALTFIFVALYGAALTGLLRPLADEKMVTRLEPIIFVIIGYYFGRLPAQQNEKTLKDEIGRQTQKADAAQHAKEQVQQARETLEEKVKNARSVLTLGAPGISASGLAEHLDKPGAVHREDPLHVAAVAALNILDS